MSGTAPVTKYGFGFARVTTRFRLRTFASSRSRLLTGAVHCTELSEENIKLAEGFLTRAGVWSRITYHQEEATAALRRTGGTWDIVYNDIDKEGYPDTVDLAYAHLRPGGLFISDNVLWSGRVLEGESDGSAATKGIQEFTRRLFAHQGFLTTIDPTRDGVAVALRL